MKLLPSYRLATALFISAACGVAHADITTFETTLSGAAEAPPNASPGTGTATVWYDSDLHTLRLATTFSGLMGTVTAAHIHAATMVAGMGTAGVATQTPTFSGFPSGVTEGSYDMTFDLTQLSSWNVNFVNAHGGTTAGAEEFFIGAMLEGKTYLNIHTSAVGSGEIRGFLNRVPDSGGTAALLLLGLPALALLARRVGLN
jgi:hypothetical protein